MTHTHTLSVNNHNLFYNTHTVFHIHVCPPPNSLNDKLSNHNLLRRRCHSPSRSGTAVRIQLVVLQRSTRSLAGGVRPLGAGQVSPFEFRTFVDVLDDDASSAAPDDSGIDEPQSTGGGGGGDGGRFSALELTAGGGGGGAGAEYGKSRSRRRLLVLAPAGGGGAVDR